MIHRRAAKCIVLCHLMTLSEVGCKATQSEPAGGPAGASVNSPPHNNGTGGNCLAITDGTQTSGQGAVWSIAFTTTLQGYYACTGTFVSAYTLLTAAHCVPCSTSIPVLLIGNGESMPELTRPVLNTYQQTGITSTQWVSGNSATCEGHDDGMGLQPDNDLALIVFPAATSTAFATVSTVHQADPASVTMVGYGLDATSTNPNQYGIKRQGTNQLVNLSQAGVTLPGLYLVAAAQNAAPTTTIVPGQGDSGGPMFNAAGQIIGVAKQAGVSGGVPFGSYTDLSSAASVAFLKQGISGGSVNFAGASAPSSCPAH